PASPLFFAGCGRRRDLPSFPTRRSSDLAVDLAGSVRGGVGALLLGADASVPTIAVLSDVRTGLPGSADERDGGDAAAAFLFGERSEEHTSELQSQSNLVCRLLLEKKKYQ